VLNSLRQKVALLRGKTGVTGESVEPAVRELTDKFAGALEVEVVKHA